MAALLLLLTQQNFSQEKISKKSIKKSDLLLKDGSKKLEEDDLFTAESLLLESIKFNPENIESLSLLADVKFQLKDYAASISLMEKILLKDHSFLNKLLPVLIYAKIGNGQFNEALITLHHSFNQNSIDSARYQLLNDRIHFAINVSEKNIKEHLTLKNLGSHINTVVSEYFPSITTSDSVLILTRRIDNGLNEDLFGSTKKDGQWNTALPLTGKINTPLNEGGQKISKNGKWMVFTGCNYPEGYGSCDIYISQNMNGEWSQRKNMGDIINTEFWESAPCLSPDMSAIYFSSNRPGGYGGMDLYVSYLNEKGNWSLPQNLGPTINTAGDEMFPFIHFDHTTLYFTSNGWKTIGGSDIYVSKKIGNTFSEPVNLGYPINTIDNESGLVVDASGKTAYFSSDRYGSIGGMDIYSFELPSEVQAFPIKTSETIVLKDVLFTTGKSALDTMSVQTLNAVVNFLKKNPMIQIQISGHTDDTGNAASNLQLSTERAKSVVDYLVKNGIASSRLIYKGFGSSQPIGNNLTEEGRAKNRRTEMLILSN